MPRPVRTTRNALTRSEITDRVWEDLGVGRDEARDLVEGVLETIKEALEDPDDGSLRVSGFGNFVVRQKAPRPGRNPKTSEEVLIEGRRVLAFRPSPLLRRAMNRREP